MIPPIVEQLLGALDGDGALGGDQARRLNRGLDRGGLGLVHLADEADLLGLLGAKDACRQGYVLDPREVADRLGQPGERANVGREANVDLLDGDLDVLGAYPDVGGAGDVDGQAERDAVEDDDDGCVKEKYNVSIYLPVTLTFLWFPYPLYLLPLLPGQGTWLFPSPGEKVRTGCCIRFSHFSIAVMHSWNS